MKKLLINLNIFALISVFVLSSSASSFFAYEIIKTKEEVAPEVIVKNTASSDKKPHPTKTTKPTNKPEPTDATQPTKKPQATNKPKPSQSKKPTSTPSNPSSGTQTEYYSPSLDMTFTYSKDEVRLSDASSSVSVYPADSSTVAISYGKIEKATDATVAELKDTYTKKYTSIYPSAKATNVQETNDSLEMTIEYEYKSLLDNSAITRYQYIYAKKLDNEFIVLNYTYNSGFDIASYTSIFKSLVDSASPQSVSTGTALSSTITDGNMTIDYDKKKWNIITQTNSNLSLYFRSSEHETDPALRFSSTSIFIRATKTSSPVDEADLLKRLSYDMDAYQSNNLNVISKDEKVDIDGVTFYKATFSYQTSSSVRTRTSYWGYEPSSKAVINIAILVDDTSSEGTKEVENVVQSITFSKTTTYNPTTAIDHTAKNMFNLIGEVYAADTTPQVEIQSSTILGRSAIAHIYNKTCLDIKVKRDADLKYSGGKSYKVCGGGFGTGFFINADGHVMTNAHVAHPNPTDAIVSSLRTKNNPFIKDFARDVEALLEDSNYPINSDEEFVYALVGVLLKSIEKDIITAQATYENYIEGSEPFNINKDTFEVENADKHYTTKTVDSFDLESNYMLALKKGDERNTEKVGITVPDLTLLQVTNTDKPVFPALSLGDEDLINTGEKIKVIGFPGSANSEEIFGETASSIASVTDGSVSALKPNFNNAFKMVQIDASVSFGNSGGPILNSKGEVIGVVTYKISGEESADFNAGISVKEVDKFLQKNNVSNEVGPTHRLLKRGINNFAKSYYKRAIDNLEQVKEAYQPTEEVVNPLIKTAQQQITAGNDKTPQISFGGYDASMFQVTGLLGSLAIAIVTALLILAKLASGKNSGGNEPTQHSDHAPAKSTIVETQPEEKPEEKPVAEAPSRFAPPKE